MFDSLVAKGYQVKFLSHARAILGVDFPIAVAELEDALLQQTIPIEEIIGSGGGETKGTQRLRRNLVARNWRQETFTIVKTINGERKESISHKVDHVRVFEPEAISRSRIALEIEWNNKDPFFDRDLENFKRLHVEGAISVGIIVTRGTTLQDELKTLVRRWVDEVDANSFEDLVRRGLQPTSRQRREVMKRVQRQRDPVSFRQAWVDHFVSDKFGVGGCDEPRIDGAVDNRTKGAVEGPPVSFRVFGSPVQNGGSSRSVSA